MNLLVCLAAHFLYGLFLGYYAAPKVMLHQDGFKKPLFYFLVPVVSLTSLGALSLLRYAGVWFLMFLIQPGNRIFEGLFLIWGFLLIIGLFFTTFLSYNLGIYLRANSDLSTYKKTLLFTFLFLSVYLSLFFPSLYYVDYAGSLPLWQHPAGVVSACMMGILGVSFLWFLKISLKP